MARKLKFAEGGSSKYDERYKRKLADIEKDYAKASKGKTGKAADVAKAKYEQRMADAKDDLAKWTKSDRTQTRAAEKSAERNLSMTRKYGAMKSATEKDVGTTARASAPTDVVKAPSIDRSFLPKAKPKPKAAAKPTPRRDAPAAKKKVELPAAFQNTRGNINLPPAPAKKPAAQTGSFSMLRDTPELSRARRDIARAEARRVTASKVGERQKTLTEKEREKAMQKAYGTAYAKGGKVDGAAIRGKTRAKLRKP